MMPARFGKYAVIRKIAAGGMADVYLCRFEGAEGFRKRVAIKVIRPHLSDEARFRQFFVREARIAATCTHPNLVQVFDFGREGASCYLAMEFVDGWNLGQVTGRIREAGVPLPEGIWRYWMEGILSGIGYLHSRGVVHRDISPSNVLLSRGGAVKIADFGIARSTSWESTPGTGWEGKFAYMSPERAMGEEATFSSDLFAAAVVGTELFLPARLLARESPELTLAKLRNFDPREVAFDGVPAALRGPLRKALATDRHERYPCAEELIKALGSAVPMIAGRADLEGFWDSLFPEDTRLDDETAIPDVSAVDPPGSIVREGQGSYGGGAGRTARIAIASAIVAAGLGGAAAWRGMFATGPGASYGTAPGSARAPVSPTPARVLPAAVATGSPAVPVETRPAASRHRTVPANPANPAVGPVSESPDANPAEDVQARASRKLPDPVSPRPAAPEPARMQPPPVESGTIEAVNAIPWARVYDGERELGVTPIRSLTLAVGEHRLRFVNGPAGIERVEKVVVRPGLNPKLIVPMGGARD